MAPGTDRRAGRSPSPLALLALLALVGLAGPESARAQDGRPGGERYQKLCAQCHGESGDGEGIAASFLLPRPRDLTAGKYKVRTTPNGALPTDADLRKVIREGMPYTSMPGWGHLPDAQIEELIAAVKSFSPQFADPARAPSPIAIPQAPKPTAESVAQGREVFEQNGCAACHGELGRGDGTSAAGLKDDWGHPIRPADLTKRWTFRGGPTRGDIYRTFTTGMNGTPMPSFAESLSDEQRWQLVDYIASLDERDEPGYAELLQVQWSDDELDLARGQELFENAPPAYFSVVGQITEPGRAFHPSANGVTVQAVYNRREIAFLVRWHDMRADEQGSNAPDLVVPAEEDLAEPAVAEASADEDDIWGDAAEPEASTDDFWGDEVAEPEAAAEDDFWGEESDAVGGTPTGASAGFSDAVAIQLPVQLPTGIAKPYFIFGDAENQVDLWFVDLATKSARRYVGAGSASLTAVEGEEVTAVASYDRGEWSVVLKRELKAAGGVTFVEAQFVPVAFSIWDGGANERGNKRGLTQWKYLYTMPRVTPSPVWPMVRSALLVLALEIGLIVWVRRRVKQNRGEAPSHV